MATKTKPSTNGSTHKHNGQSPPSRLADVLPPLDAVSHGEQVEAKPGTPEAKPQEGRTAAGTFAVGNQFARGNPTARRMAALRSALLNNLTAEKMTTLGDRLYELAIGGDLAAAKLLLTYAIGKAPEAVDADRLDLDEFSIIDAAPTMAQLLRLFLDGADPKDAAEVFKMLHPQGQDKLLGKISDELEDMDLAIELEEPCPMARALLEERKARIGK